MCRTLRQWPALHVLWVSCTTRRVVWAYARCVMSVSIRVWLLRRRASAVLQDSTRAVSVRAAVLRVRAVRSHRVSQLLPALLVELDSTLLLVLSGALCVQLVRMTTTATQRHRVWDVRAVSTLVRGRRTARCARLVRLTWTAMPRLCALRVRSVTMRELVRLCAHLASLASMTMIAMRVRCV